MRLPAELGSLRVGRTQCLITAKGVRRELAKLAHSAADFLMVLIPIHDHGDFSCLEKFGSRAIILPARANMISSPVHPNLPGAKAVLAVWRSPLLVCRRSSGTYSKELYS